MDMPESHEKAERGQMAEDGLAGASPQDQTAFPSNVEDQVPLAGPSQPLTAPQSLSATLPQHQRSSRDWLVSPLVPLLFSGRSARWSCNFGLCFSQGAPQGGLVILARADADRQQSNAKHCSCRWQR